VNKPKFDQAQAEPARPKGTFKRKIQKGTFKVLSEDINVRAGVASSASTSPEILMKLASDKYWGVRCCVAKNPSTPREVLEAMLLDAEMHDHVIQSLLRRNKLEVS
jgi:hypothetical protein